MPKVSAGLVMYRDRGRGIEVLLVHPGGPFFAKKDDGYWSIPKGQLDDGEPAFEAALREFEEETGLRPKGPFIELTPVQQKSGKLVHAWAFEGDCDPDTLESNTTLKEWPAGVWKEYPEIDRAGWFDVRAAARKANPAQGALFEELVRTLKDGRRHGPA